jgi:hypothetical protein
MPINLEQLSELIRLLNPYSADMEPAAIEPTPNEDGGVVTEVEKARVQFHVELDDHIANYSSTTWTFRGNPETVKRALRITYRYPLKGLDGKPTGFYATEHLLIGYAGGNGG